VAIGHIQQTGKPRPKNIAWSWRNALFGALLASVGTVVIATGHVTTGLPLLFGALPAAIIGLLPTRKARRLLVVIGVLFGLSMMAGSFVAQWWWLAVPAMFLFGLGGALLAARSPLGLLALSLCVPLAGIGLSYAGLKNSVGVALTIIVGSLVAYGWSLLLPEFAPTPRKPGELLSADEAVDYGIRLGLTGATAAAVGYAFGADYIGWICGSALLVMRPAADMQKLRSAGRILSVLVGAFAASWLLGHDLSPVAIALVAGGSLIIASVTRASRWYITPAFSTFLVFWSCSTATPQEQASPTASTNVSSKTISGVTIAYVFGLLIPKLRSAHPKARSRVARRGSPH
jgi:hypothetical protein